MQSVSGVLNDIRAVTKANVKLPSTYNIIQQYIQQYPYLQHIFTCILHDNITYLRPISEYNEEQLNRTDVLVPSTPQKNTHSNDISGSYTHIPPVQVPVPVPESLVGSREVGGRVGGRRETEDQLIQRLYTFARDHSIDYYKVSLTSYVLYILLLFLIYACHDFYV